MEVEEAIRKDIRAWSKETLEKINPEFNGLAPCPYAKKAWVQDKVGIGFKKCPAFQDLTTIISTFDDRYDVVILVDLAFKEDAKKFYQHIDGLNGAIAQGIFIERDIWLMGFHPDDEPHELSYDIDFTPLGDRPYAMIFVQRLSKLHEASMKLKDTGYYDKYTQQHGTEEILEVREAYYGRLKNGT